MVSRRAFLAGAEVSARKAFVAKLDRTDRWLPAKQYAHLAAISVFVVAPAWGFHPILGLVVGYFGLAAWALTSPLTSFDEALGIVIIRLFQMSHKKVSNAS